MPMRMPMSSVGPARSVDPEVAAVEVDAPVGADRDDQQTEHDRRGGRPAEPPERAPRELVERVVARAGSISAYAGVWTKLKNQSRPIHMIADDDVGDPEGPGQAEPVEDLHRTLPLVKWRERTSRWGRSSGYPTNVLLRGRGRRASSGVGLRRPVWSGWRSGTIIPEKSANAITLPEVVGDPALDDDQLAPGPHDPGLGPHDRALWAGRGSERAGRRSRACSRPGWNVPARAAAEPDATSTSVAIAPPCRLPEPLNAPGATGISTVTTSGFGARRRTRSRAAGAAASTSAPARSSSMMSAEKPPYG